MLAVYGLIWDRGRDVATSFVPFDYFLILGLHQSVPSSTILAIKFNVFVLYIKKSQCTVISFTYTVEKANGHRDMSYQKRCILGNIIVYMV